MKNSQARSFLQSVRKQILRLWSRHLIGVDRQLADNYVLSIGTFSPAYVFLVVTSSAIATLGLMLNSVAVIIGAMLIAPLMGPIILLGFAVASTNIRHGIQAAKSLVVGVAMALATSYLIVKFSPFVGPTSEILARTHPNLFDLLVAIVSGIAGGYAVVRREIGTVAGVAIATALMPPLATAGFGLASGEQAIFNGAFFLFLTNMIAISFSATGMAIFYGLGNLHAPRELIWKTIIGLAVMAILSIPLMQSLNEAVSRALTEKQIESVLREEVNEKSWQLGQISSRNEPGGILHISALVFVPEIDPKANERVSQRIGHQLGTKIQLDLNQVLFGEKKVLPLTVQAVQLKPVELNDAEAMRRYLKRFLALPVTAVEIDAAKSTITLQAGPAHPWRLKDIMAMETSLAANLPTWKVILVPVLTTLPRVTFQRDSVEPDSGGRADIREILWALERWKIREVRVFGGASKQEMRKEKLLKTKRANALAEILKKEGIECGTGELRGAESLAPFARVMVSAEGK